MSDDRFAASQFLDLTQTRHGDLFSAEEPVWTALGRIKSYLSDLLQERPAADAEVSDRAHIGPDVYLGEGVTIEPFVTIKGPAWIGPGTTIRSGAYLRENVIAGSHVTMGNSCEFKNCLLFDHAQVPHFNYVGDSILGHKAHLGAGVILSNVRLDRQDVVVTAEGERLPSGLRKFGAIIGDHSEVGCNAVLSPGTLVGRECIVYPGTQLRGYVPSRNIVKLTQQQSFIQLRKRD